jgi:hypothetical protein
MRSIRLHVFVLGKQLHKLAKIGVPDTYAWSFAKRAIAFLIDAPQHIQQPELAGAGFEGELYLSPVVLKTAHEVFVVVHSA